MTPCDSVYQVSLFLLNELNRFYGVSNASTPAFIPFILVLPRSALLVQEHQYWQASSRAHNYWLVGRCSQAVLWSKVKRLESRMWQSMHCIAMLGLITVQYSVKFTKQMMAWERLNRGKIWLLKYNGSSRMKILHDWDRRKSINEWYKKHWFTKL